MPLTTGSTAMTTQFGKQLGRSFELSSQVARLFQKRSQIAWQHFSERIQGLWTKCVEDPAFKPRPLWEAWKDWARYSVDFAQRSILFWDTMRQRGNQFLERERAGKPPVLHFDYELVLDARTFQRPVNYALLRIVPPAGVTVDAKSLKKEIIDPRAGHGPGIGGFKDDSEVGVALRAGHPVYFVMFYPDPQPGQTMLDVCAAEAAFVRKVRELHPESPKPAIVGNCQGGWAAMMLAASNPDDTGPIVINGAPMSYWGGAWREGEGDNPMRYAGGLLGGTWLASLTADLGHGKFDGAWLVQNFENLNPANTFWDKYYNLFANVDTEPPRFLEFERWWGGFYLMNRDEIEWITRNLFVGNKLWSGDVHPLHGKAFDLREIKSPIILFASMGDNITPPQQAFNWVADVYGSTEEIKANGQVIVGLLHQDIGHLGIFVSGRVAKKEHAQIVSVLKSVETLPPGLYGMKISEEKAAGGKVGYHVEFVEHRLEDVVKRLNRFERADEKAFEAVAAASDFNQRAYELFAQPLVQAGASEGLAKLQEAFHPLRVQRWAFSDLNPFLAWLAPAAAAVKERRQALGPDTPFRRTERAMSEITSAALDYYREVRDAVSEAAFYQIYGNLFSHLAERGIGDGERPRAAEPREQPVVKQALAAIEEGGYPEAFARVGALLARQGEPLPLERLQLRRDLIEDYRELLPETAPDQQRRIRGEQDIIVHYEPERAVETLPRLLADPADRKRLLTLFGRVLRDERVQSVKPTAAQVAMLDRINTMLRADGPTGRRPPSRPTTH